MEVYGAQWFFIHGSSWLPNIYHGYLTFIIIFTVQDNDNS